MDKKFMDLRSKLALAWTVSDQAHSEQIGQNEELNRLQMEFSMIPHSDGVKKIFWSEMWA
jgi:hypothetical protein